MKAQITKYFEDEEIEKQETIDLDSCVQTKGKSDDQIIAAVYDCFDMPMIYDFEVTDVELIKDSTQPKMATGRHGYGEDEGEDQGIRLRG